MSDSQAMISEKPVEKRQYIALNGGWRKREGREKEGEKRKEKEGQRERDRGPVIFTSINIKYSKVK